MEKYVPVMILAPLISILVVCVIADFCVIVRDIQLGRVEMKKTVVMFGEYALVALVTVIIGVVFMVIYPIAVGVNAVKRVGRFFSDNG